MIALSDKLQSMKLGEMRATRELAEVKEKNNYISRLLRTSSDQVKKLEEKVAEAEAKMHKREEEFRRADNDRMRRFFNARYDDIPAALNAPEFFPGTRTTVAKEPMLQRAPSTVAQVATPVMSQVFNASSGSGDTKFLEGKLKKVEAELNRALEDIRAKDAIISRFKDWQLADKYLAEDEVLRD